MGIKIEFNGFWPPEELSAAREKLERLYDRLPYDSNCELRLNRGFGQTGAYAYALHVASMPFTIDRKGIARGFDQLIEVLEYEVRQRIARWHATRGVDL